MGFEIVQADVFFETIFSKGRFFRDETTEERTAQGERTPRAGDFESNRQVRRNGKARIHAGESSPGGAEVLWLSPAFGIDRRPLCD